MKMMQGADLRIPQNRSWRRSFQFRYPRGAEAKGAGSPTRPMKNKCFELSQGRLEASSTEERDLTEGLWVSRFAAK